MKKSKTNTLILSALLFSSLFITQLAMAGNPELTEKIYKTGEIMADAGAVTFIGGSVATGASGLAAVTLDKVSDVLSTQAGALRRDAVSLMHDSHTRSDLARAALKEAKSAKIFRKGAVAETVAIASAIVASAGGVAVAGGIEIKDNSYKISDSLMPKKIARPGSSPITDEATASSGGRLQ